MSSLGDEGELSVRSLPAGICLPEVGLAVLLVFGVDVMIEIARSGDEGSMTLKGWGVGLAYTKPGSWFARLDYARRIGSDELMSREAESKGRIWFMAGKVF